MLVLIYLTLCLSRDRRGVGWGGGVVCCRGVVGALGRGLGRMTTKAGLMAHNQMQLPGKMIGGFQGGPVPSAAENRGGVIFVHSRAQCLDLHMCS